MRRLSPAKPVHTSRRQTGSAGDWLTAKILGLKLHAPYIVACRDDEQRHGSALRRFWDEAFGEGQGAAAPWRLIESSATLGA